MAGGGGGMRCDTVNERAVRILLECILVKFEIVLILIGTVFIRPRFVWPETWICLCLCFCNNLDYTGADPGFGQGGPASEAKSCRCSEVESHEQSEQSVAGVQGLLKGPGSFWVFNAQICILTHSRDSFSVIFDIYFDTKS